MTEPLTAPYGSWLSPITPDLIVADAVRIADLVVDDGSLYWSESRPKEGGLYFVVRERADQSHEDQTRAPWNVRTRVHEYGGASFTVDRGVLYFSNFADQRLYRQEPGGEPVPISPATPLRFADAVPDRRRERLFCVVEDHSREGAEAANCIASVPMAGGEPPRRLAEGRDFYAAPRLSPDGQRLAWLCWDHPDMPWDAAELWVGELDADGGMTNSVRIAGGEGESIFQPEWAPDGGLLYICDRTGWWNLYRWDGGEAAALAPRAAEFGEAQWVFGMSTYAVLSADELVCTFNESGLWHLARLDLRTRQLTEIETPYTDFSHLRAAGSKVYFTGGSSMLPPELVEWDIDAGTFRTIRRSATIPDAVKPYLSAAEAVEFPTENGLTAHALFYAPYNPEFRAPEGELPPLLVASHGGPTSSASSVLALSIQYWTSRGVAVLDVNYGGSTGFGRDYRERLKGRWGIVDVDDCVNGALFLARLGRVDGGRLGIRGGSAGGYTTLAALTFRNVFHAGASYFGVSDLEALARDTHKFESRYLDSLVGPYPERADLYRERAPISFAENLSAPVIFFQGAEDRVVPPNQAERMVEVLREKGVPVGYYLFASEEHGFRRSENIQRCLNAELLFYSMHLFRCDLRY